ncbi:MAG: hypothetical protein R2724_10720 [Bryobacterales bacterium]
MLDRLLDWYARHARDLPWRRTQDPYRIWVSEIMLQQTRVEAVIPFYERFLERFSSPEALAAAPEPQVLDAWAGLGYYRRAHAASRRAAHRRRTRRRFPRDYDAIRALPGIGEYTAGAVASIAFELPHAAVDGNVLRVLSVCSTRRATSRPRAFGPDSAREHSAGWTRRRRASAAR